MAMTQEIAATPATLADERTRLAEYLRRSLQLGPDGSAGFLASASQHVLAAPGKLFRPLLLLDACRAAGGDPERAFPAAAGTEYGHIASLVHDDIIDGDAERRGQIALHVKYGEPAAILTGDLLIFHTFLSYTDCLGLGVPADRVVQAIRVLASTCVELCEGQALEATITGNLGTTEARYLRVIRLKTASVCRASAEIGACLAGADRATQAALASYGECLGMSFQIVDDVLCFDGSANRVGKPLESDFRNRRVTLPLIYAMRRGDPKVRRRLTELFTTDASEQPTAYAELATTLRETGALRQARSTAAQYAARARNQLDHLPASDARHRLSALTTALLFRDH